MQAHIQVMPGTLVKFVAGSDFESLIGIVIELGESFEGTPTYYVLIPGKYNYYQKTYIHWVLLSKALIIGKSKLCQLLFKK